MGDFEYGIRVIRITETSHMSMKYLASVWNHRLNALPFLILQVRLASKTRIDLSSFPEKCELRASTARQPNANFTNQLSYPKSHQLTSFTSFLTRHYLSLRSLHSPWPRTNANANPHSPIIRPLYIPHLAPYYHQICTQLRHMA